MLASDFMLGNLTLDIGKVFSEAGKRSSHRSSSGITSKLKLPNLNFRRQCKIA